MKTLIKTSPQEDYLTKERAAEYKSEYFNGKMLSMAGTSPVHNDIGQNITFFLELNALNRAKTFKKKYKIRSGDQRVYNALAQSYCYPDVVVIKELALYAANDAETLVNPYIIFEILSPSTERIDRTQKYEVYTAMDSLVVYGLVSQNKTKVELFRKDANDIWNFEQYSELTATIELGFSFLTLSEIYDEIIF